MEKTQKTPKPPEKKAWEVVIDQINGCSTIDKKDKKTAVDYITEQGKAGKIPHARAKVECLFVWAYTPQGQDFWNEIDKHLRHGKS